MYQRNVRVAFPTNSTATNLATLNQNKNIVCGYGLNKKFYGINVEPTAFDANQPMITTAFTSTLNYQQCVDEWYGVRNNDTTAPDTFATNTPRHQFGQPWPIQNYYALTTSDNDTFLGGWPTFQEGIKEVDADLTSGTLIMEHTYQPKVGLIKIPIEHINTGLPHGTTAQTKPIVTGMGIIRPRRMDLVKLQSVNQTANETFEIMRMAEQGSNNADSVHFNIQQRIEKSQFFYPANKLESHFPSETQPSVHVGVQPTHALTTTSILNEQSNNSFTDTQAYFEVVAECKIRTAQPTYMPLASVANCRADEEMYAAGASTAAITYVENSTMYRGKYETVALSS